ncbi:hypothetical protein CEXT_63161 [Caerostris extrusa]|uniref:Uncharacterized protein n=1 Tax=Caerostris extrusa TaxID=172846 RepID=A0AAV4X2K5_CAEEX|nr:hypothetical protein CEXT_63161 [Caerostris extrusa]
MLVLPKQYAFSMRRRDVSDDKPFRGRLLRALVLRNVVIRSALILVKGNRAITKVKFVKIHRDDVLSYLDLSSVALCLCTFMISKWILKRVVCSVGDEICDVQFEYKREGEDAARFDISLDDQSIYSQHPHLIQHHRVIPVKFTSNLMAFSAAHLSRFNIPIVIPAPQNILHFPQFYVCLPTDILFLLPKPYAFFDEAPGRK